jgi:hypothetical protein
VKGENKKERIQSILKFLRKRGKIFITPTVYNGDTCLRAALVNWRTSKEDIDIATEELNLAYKEIVSQSKFQHS